MATPNARYVPAANVHGPLGAALAGYQAQRDKQAEAAKERRKDLSEQVGTELDWLKLEKELNEGARREARTQYGSAILGAYAGGAEIEVLTEQFGTPLVGDVLSTAEGAAAEQERTENRKREWEGIIGDIPRLLDQSGQASIAGGGSYAGGLEKASAALSRAPRDSPERTDMTKILDEEMARAKRKFYRGNSNRIRESREFIERATPHIAHPDFTFRPDDGTDVVGENLRSARRMMTAAPLNEAPWRYQIEEKLRGGMGMDDLKAEITAAAPEDQEDLTAYAEAYFDEKIRPGLTPAADPDFQRIRLAVSRNQIPALEGWTVDNINPPTATEMMGKTAEGNEYTAEDLLLFPKLQTEGLELALGNEVFQATYRSIQERNQKRGITMSDKEIVDEVQKRVGYFDGEYKVVTETRSAIGRTGANFINKILGLQRSLDAEEGRDAEGARAVLETQAKDLRNYILRHGLVVIPGRSGGGFRSAKVSLPEHADYDTLEIPVPSRLYSRFTEFLTGEWAPERIEQWRKLLENLEEAVERMPISYEAIARRDLAENFFGHRPAVGEMLQGMIPPHLRAPPSSESNKEAEAGRPQEGAPEAGTTPAESPPPDLTQYGSFEIVETPNAANN